MSNSFDLASLSMKSNDDLVKIIKILTLQLDTANSNSNSSQPTTTGIQPQRKQFTPRLLPPQCKHLIIGTSRVRDIYARTIGMNCAVHTYGGASLNDLKEVVTRYENLHLTSVTIVAGFIDAASDMDDSIFKESWDGLVQEIVSKFSPVSLIVPDTIPCLNKTTNARINLIQTSLQSMCLDTPTIGDVTVYNPPLNGMFSINKDVVGTAFFTRDGVHLSAIGTNLLGNFLAGFIRSIHPLTSDQKKDISHYKTNRINSRQNNQQPPTTGTNNYQPYSNGYNANYRPGVYQSNYHSGYQRGGYGNNRL